MQRLYLIRRKLESFVGPMSVDDLKEAFQRMEFGLQDEVSGHCGRWVVLEDRKDLKDYYPEVFPAIHTGIMDPWTDQPDTDQLPRKIDRQAEKSSRRGRQKSKGRSSDATLNIEESRRSQGGDEGLPKAAYLFLLGGLVALGIAGYLLQQNGGIKEVASINIFGENREDKFGLKYAEKYVKKGEFKALHSYMRKFYQEAKTEVVKNENARRNPWLPYLRFYAFHGRGAVVDLAPGLLKGRNAPSAPGDCSFRAWKKRWQETSSTWSDMVFGKKLEKSQWARLLAWDPDWIRRRPGVGWMSPRNYYGACIYMAYQAFEGLITNNDFISSYISAEPEAETVLKTIKNRLGWLSHKANGTNTYSGTPVGRTSTGFLPTAYWTCLESASNVKSVATCRRGYKIVDKKWSEFEKDREFRSYIRLSLDSSKPMDLSVLMAQIGRGKGRNLLRKNDPFTRLDFRAEARFLAAFALSRGNLKTALKAVDREFPETKFGRVEAFLKNSLDIDP